MYMYMCMCMCMCMCTCMCMCLCICRCRCRCRCRFRCRLRFRFWRDFSGVKRTCWTTGSWRSCLSLEVVSSIPAVSTIIYRFLCGFICVSLCQSIKIKNQQICISPAPGRSSKLTHTGVEIDTCAFQTGCQLSSAATGMPLELRFLARFQWREAYVLDNWQLAELPQSGGREFDPRRVHDNLSVPLWVYMRFPVPEHQN